MEKQISIFKIKNLEDLKNIKKYMEANFLGKPNFSELARELGVDRRTVKKYYDGYKRKTSKNRKSKIDAYHDVIKTLLSKDNKQKFYYKSHLYRYLVREHNLKVKQNTFNRYILKNDEFRSYFETNQSKKCPKIEKSFGMQAQFDWKEDIKFVFKTGEVVRFDVACLTMSASRYKVWSIYPNRSRDCVMDFLTTAFEKIEGVAKEIYIDNAKSMMDIARSKKSEGKVNKVFEEFSKNFGFDIKPCMAYRPQTKAKVENPMRIVDEIMTYNGVLMNYSELYEKLNEIVDEVNLRISQATNLPPCFLMEKEREHLLPLPQDIICSQYKIKAKMVKVNKNSLINYNSSKYSVPTCFINKKLSVKEIDNNLYIYNNREIVVIHEKSDIVTTTYNKVHYQDLFRETFTGQANIKEQTLKNLKELEKFNEQISEATREFRST